MRKLMASLALVVGVALAGALLPASSAQAPVKAPPTTRPQPAHPRDGVGPEQIPLKSLMKLLGVAGAEEATPPSPEHLNKLYQAVWEKVGEVYHLTEPMKDWEKWKKPQKEIQTLDDFDECVKAMLSSLNDKWSWYISAKDIEQARANARAGLVKLGLSISPLPDGSYKVDFIRYKGPAYGTTIRTGDIIRSVNGKMLNGLSQDEAEKQLEGKIGDKAVVVFFHDDTEDTVELTFAPTPPVAVEAKLLAGNVLYCRFPDFGSPDNVNDMLEAFYVMQKQAKGDVQGLVLDLRGNPGGRFDLSLRVASLFLKKGTICTATTRSNRMYTHETYEVLDGLPHLRNLQAEEVRALMDMLQTAPLLLLTDGSTASASEIVTGALKDNGRATVIGETTYGKGVGYVRFGVEFGGSMSITTLHYLTPSGFNLATGGGITPKIKVSQPRGGQVDEQLHYAVTMLKARTFTPVHNPPPAPPSRPAIPYLVLGGIALVLAIALASVLYLRRRKGDEDN